MKKLTRRQAGWLGALSLFVAVMLSMVAIFRGSLWFLGASLIFLLIGLWALKQYMSGQSLS